jgi:membrane-associated protease RseP (regulator of RpoE activity)
MLKTARTRFLSTLLLTPAIILVLVWIGRFAGADEVARIGIAQFLLWAAGVGFGVAATITLYIAYLTKADRRQ